MSIKKRTVTPASRSLTQRSTTTLFSATRFNLLYTVILLALLAILGRVAWLQLINPDELISQEDQRSVREERIVAPRGMIEDRNGKPLAVSVPADALWADNKAVLSGGGVTNSDRWQALASVLHMPLASVAQRINRNPNARFIYLARLLEPQQAYWISQLHLPGIHLREESRRFYPAGRTAANLIGFTNIDDQGIEGVEKSFNRQLTGKNGLRRVRKDRFGNVVENITRTPAVPAHNIRLSIDLRLQTVLEDALDNAVSWNKAQSGAAVLIDVQTGEILAMASDPGFNPNNRQGSDQQDFRNRAISDTFEPGSTVKPMVIITALHQGIVQPDSVINSHPWTVDGHLIRDVGSYDSLSLTGILQKSSDVGVARLSLAMPVQALLNTYHAFGLGQKAGLGLSGESSGFLPQRRYWSNLDRATLAFGYGLRVTPLQLAHAYAIIASSGLRRPLSITRIDPPVNGVQIMPKELVDEVKTMMESVALPGGGGTKAAVHNYRVAVKTGTAKKVASDGKYEDKYISWTAGIAPARDPRFALVVMINDPENGQYYGGAVCAPVFSQIMGDTLRIENVMPDGIPANSDKLLIAHAPGQPGTANK